MKRLLLLVTLLAVVLPGPAGAAGATVTPCRDKIFHDWYRDGKISSAYPLGCYRDALSHIPVDASIYSSLSEDVRAAMRAATRRSHGLPAPSEVGHGLKATGAGSVKAALISIQSPPRSPAATGVVATASNAPLPILVLGGIALALAAAGAIGIGVRHARGRRR